MNTVKRLFGIGAGIADKSSAIVYYAAINCIVYCLVLRRIVSDGKRCGK